MNRIRRCRAPRVTILVMSAVALTAGCEPTETIHDRIRACAGLPGASASQNTELQTLVAAIRSTGGTPDQLDPPTLGGASDPGANAGAALAECLNDGLRWRLSPLVEDLMAGRHVALTGDEKDAATAGAAIDGFLRRNSDLRAKLSTAAERPRCVFDAGFQWGYFAGLRFVDDSGLATRIALLEAVAAGRDEDAVRVWSALDRSLRWAQWLSRVRRVEPRVLAATLRAEALATVQQLAATRAVERQTAEILYGRLRDALAAWPADSRMLRGDRAVAMHSYEAIRIGLLDRLLTADERRALEDRGELSRLERATPEQIDRDEVNYLNAIATMLGADGAEGVSEPPFYERRTRFEKAIDTATVAPNLFAERLFLADIVEAQRLAARDRARCEAWCIALSAASDLKTPPFRTNPATGRDYSVVRVGERVVVRPGDSALDDISLPVW